MEIKCLGSGSTGNCYIVHQEGITYLLDAGVDIRKVRANINLNDLDFAFVSHEHEDHSLNQKLLAEKRLEIIDGKLIEVFTKVALTGENKAKIKVYAFPIEHSFKNCICKNSGLIVETQNESLLYLTDFSVCKYDLTDFKFTTIMVECNYQEELMDNAPQDYKHVRQRYTHMGFEGLKTFISKAINLEPVKEIILIHLSTEEELIDRETIGLKSELEWHKPIGVCKQQGGIDWYGKRKEGF